MKRKTKSIVCNVYLLRGDRYFLAQKIYFVCKRTKKLLRILTENSCFYREIRDGKSIRMSISRERGGSYYIIILCDNRVPKLSEIKKMILYEVLQSR